MYKPVKEHRGKSNKAECGISPGHGQILTIKAESGVGTYPINTSDSWAQDLESF